MSATMPYCLLICKSKNEQKMSWSIVQLLPFINYNQYVTRLWYQVLWMRPPAHITHSKTRPRRTGISFPVSPLSSLHFPLHPLKHIFIPFSLLFFSLSSHKHKSIHIPAHRQTVNGSGTVLGRNSLEYQPRHRVPNRLQCLVLVNLKLMKSKVPSRASLYN